MRTTKKHRRIYEDHYNVRLPSIIEIHHIDGNHDNNDLTNLMAVTIKEHFEIHKSQGDYAAAFRISQRMNVSKEEKSRLASLAATKANAEGKCGFKLGHASQAGKGETTTHLGLCEGKADERNCTYHLGRSRCRAS